MFTTFSQSNPYSLYPNQSGMFGGSFGAYVSPFQGLGGFNASQGYSSIGGYSMPGYGMPGGGASYGYPSFGGIPPQAAPTNTPAALATYPTADYLQVIQEADTTTFGTTTATPDGVVDCRELQQYRQGLQQSLAFSMMMEQMISRFFGNSTNSFVASLQTLITSNKEATQKKLAVTDTVLRNFNRFANPNNTGFTQGTTPTPDEIKAVSTIDATDIAAVAAFDGNANDITARDVEKQPAPPTPGVETVDAKIDRLFSNPDPFSFTMKFFLKKLLTLDIDSAEATSIMDKLDLIARYITPLEAPINDVLFDIKKQGYDKLIAQLNTTIAGLPADSPDLAALQARLANIEQLKANLLAGQSQPQQNTTPAPTPV